jgi:replicative DNA helicase
LLGLSQRQPPHNTQAEQALLGALLANNRAYERTCGFLKPEHFADPVHGRIYGAIARRIDAGQLADAVTLRTEFEHAGVLDDVGGTAYLAQLLSAMVGIINAGEYGVAIHDAWLRRELIEIGETVVNNAFGSDQDMPSGADQIEAAEQALFNLYSNGAKSNSEPVPIAAAVQKAIDEGERESKGRGISAVSTGLPSLDAKILALRAGHLIVIGARPGMGKTSMARTLGLNISAGRGTTPDGELIDDQRLGRPVLHCALEETETDWGAANLAQLAGVSIGSVLSGEVLQDTEAAARLVLAQKRLAETPYYVDDSPRQGLRQIAMKARRMQRRLKGGLGAVIVDYLQLMPDPPGVKEKRLAVGQNAYGLKDLAKELGCPIILLSQLSRRVDERTDHRPTMSDLRETGEIEDAADVIIFLYRESFYYAQNRPKYDPEKPEAYDSQVEEWERRLSDIEGMAQAIIPKVRRGQAPTVVDLYFNGPKARFEEPRRNA